MIVGIDEVGRGPWAGPLVVGAVVLGDVQIEGLTDSKKLSKKRRDELAAQIKALAQGYGLGWVEAHEIDEIGISAALVLATKRALEEITVPYHEIIIDGTVNFLKDTGKGPYVTTMKKADLLIGAVSAASILAKVARDMFMEEQEALYPGYGFASHVGYGTAKHQAAIKELGVTPLHRLSFAPLAHYRAAPTPQGVATLNTRQVGDTAENIAAEYLRSHGHDILERNWKLKLCEIDIISRKDDIIYFTEVKYRKTASQGDGLAAITHKKLRQMEFAAGLYATNKRLNESSLQLSAIALSGEPPEVREYIATVAD